MCLVAFQNIFRKIFSSVWKRSWKRRRKRQNPKKPGQNPEEHVANSRSTARSRDRRSDLAINGAISDPNRRCDLAKRRSRLARTVLREIAIDGAISQSIDRDRHERCFARALFARSRVLSLSRSPFARALFARPQFRKSFEVKIGTEMNFRGQRYYFSVN